jgi:hypothetical protein
LLAERGYLDGEQVTERGERLARLWGESDLLTAECLRHGAWDGLEPAELAAVVSALVYESRRDHGPMPRVPSGPVSDALAATVRLWAELEGESGARLLRRTGALLLVTSFFAFTRPGGRHGEDTGREGAVCHIRLRTSARKITPAQAPAASCRRFCRRSCRNVPADALAGCACQSAVHRPDPSHGLI